MSFIEGVQLLLNVLVVIALLLTYRVYRDLRGFASRQTGILDAERETGQRQMQILEHQSDIADMQTQIMEKQRRSAFMPVIVCGRPQLATASGGAFRVTVGEIRNIGHAAARQAMMEVKWSAHVVGPGYLPSILPGATEGSERRFIIPPDQAEGLTEQSLERSDRVLVKIYLRDLQGGCYCDSYTWKFMGRSGEKPIWELAEFEQKEIGNLPQPGLG